MQEEIWKKIDWAEGDYYVSSNGVVKKVRGDGSSFILSQNEDKDGYMRVAIFSDGSFKNRPVHRVVAIAFVPNPDGLVMVNHENRNRKDNRASNVKWATKASVLLNKSMTQRANPSTRVGITGKDNKFSKPVVQLTRYGEFIAEYFSMNEAAAAVKIHASKISDVCNGKRYTAANFVWMFKSEYEQTGFTNPKVKSTSEFCQKLTEWRKRIDKTSSNDVMYWLDVIIRASKMYYGVQEEWKEVDGFNGAYLVSNFGRIKSIDRNVDCKNYMTIFKRGVIHRQMLSGGYPCFVLSHLNKRISGKTHRLVLKTFQPDGDFSLEVNHIDFDKTNCYVENLEFCSKSDNLRHMWEYVDKRPSKDLVFNGVSVVRLDKDYNYIDQFNSMAEAARTCKVNSSSIMNVCKGSSFSAGGYRWMYLEDYEKNLVK